MRLRSACIAAAALFAFSAAGADAATQVGQTFTPTNSCGPGTRVQVSTADGRYVIPSAGVITSWSFERSSSAGGSPVRFKVARAAGGTNFTAVGESAVENPAVGLNTYPTRITVQAGDVLGLFQAPASVFLCSRVAATAVAAFGPFGVDVAPGSTQSFPTTDTLELSVSASLEPDCDADGFGDETQDADILTCPPGPAVTITKAPKDRIKTKRKRKRVTFEFAAGEPAGFECVLDGGTYAACVSPYSVKVRPGKHAFAVRAIDFGGNAGDPAIDRWKVKRKRR